MLGNELKLNMTNDQLWPAILEVQPESLEVYPIHIGRSAGQYHHHQLFNTLIKHRCSWEMQGALALRSADTKVDQLKRRIIKCEKKTLATWILTMPQQQVVLSKNDEPLDDRPPSRSVTLPPELLHLVLSFLPDTASLVRLSRVSRVYYITACNILIQRLRMSMERVKQALPTLPDGRSYWDEDETHVFDMYLERPQDIGFRTLQHRVMELKSLAEQISEWTKQWSPRRKMNKSVSLAGPRLSLRMMVDPTHRAI
ncbi:hypothetical protein DM01DRAFT_109685 [Hesseltinella vesiculosa]|uniref:F-box domain-containing protein n=1 Tax=Hesseltinella vesiculosa TaxID=101127 RepID=A0A1X2GP67_9FUNG|nr:hypothetical protein DM01DRAFT_109685 [Hesseltinella vesiculosa]